MPKGLASRNCTNCADEWDVGRNKVIASFVTKDNLAENSRQRMDIMVETTDGFVIAEADMKFRGPGDLEGTAQSGLPFDLRIANLVAMRH